MSTLAIRFLATAAMALGVVKQIPLTTKKDPVRRLTTIAQNT
jgi:hypothetical protein